MDYYSARLLYVILVDDGRPRRRLTFDESVIVFRARDIDHAFERALELGRAAEHRYHNQRGQAVRWAFVEVLTLDHIGRKLDGCEVASKLHTRTVPQPVPFTERFRPERSRPGQSF
jgi:hypothetical protein